MNIKQAKQFFSFGVIKGFSIVKDPMGSDWLLQIRTATGTETLETAVGYTKKYSSLDTLIGQVSVITGGQVTKLDLTVG